jgi:hypothetical protein
MPAVHSAAAEALVVVDPSLDRRVVGVLNAAYVLRRYATALEGRRRDPNLRIVSFTMRNEWVAARQV